MRIPQVHVDRREVDINKEKQQTVQGNEGEVMDKFHIRVFGNSGISSKLI